MVIRVCPFFVYKYKCGDFIKSQTLQRTRKRGKERETNPWSWSCATTPKRVQGNRLLLPQSLPLWIAKVYFDLIMFMVLREIHVV